MMKMATRAGFIGICIATFIIYVLSISQNTNAQATQAFPSTIEEVVYSPDGNYLAVAYQTGKLEIISEDEAVLNVTRNEIVDISWSPDSTLLAIAENGIGGSGIVIFDVTQRQMVELAALTSSIQSIDWSPNSPYIVSVQIENTGSNREQWFSLHEYRQNLNELIGLVSVTSNVDIISWISDDTFATGTIDESSDRMGVIYRHNESEIEMISELESMDIFEISLSQSGDFFATVNLEGVITVIDNQEYTTLSILEPDVVSARPVEITWSPNDNFMAYVIQVDDEGSYGNVYLHIINWRSGELLFSTSLISDTIVSQRAVDWSPDGTRIAYAYEDTYQIMNAIPEAPTNLSSSHVLGGNLELQWQDNSSFETGFAIERSLNEIDWIEITTVSENITSAQISRGDCVTAQDHYYRIVALNDAVSLWSEPTESVFVSQIECPASLTGTYTPATIDLDWADNATDETAFHIERASDDGTGNPDTFSEIGTVPADTTSFTDTESLACGTYYYRVRAFRADDSLFSDYSNVASVEIPCDPLPGGDLILTDGIYRAVQRDGDPRVYIERDMAAGLDSFDSNPVDGWTLMGRTNGAGDNGELQADVPCFFSNDGRRRGFHPPCEGLPHCIIQR